MSRSISGVMIPAWSSAREKTKTTEGDHAGHTASRSMPETGRPRLVRPTNSPYRTVACLLQHTHVRKGVNTWRSALLRRGTGLWATRRESRARVGGCGRE